MKVGITQSFGAKVFVFTTLIVLTVVGIITAKNSLYLRENLNRQYQGSLIESTQLLGERVLNLFTRWDNRLAYFSQALLQARSDERSRLIKTFLQTEKGLLGLELVELQGSGISREIGQHWLEPGSLDRDRLIQQLGEREILLSRHPSRPDALLLLRRIRIQDTERVLVSMLAFETSILPLRGLQDQKIRLFLLDDGFQDLLQGSPYEQLVQENQFVQKASEIMRGDMGSGYLGELRQGEEKSFVAYYHLPAYPLILVIHQDASAIDASIREFVLDMLRWTVFFVLIAIFSSSTIIRSLVSNLKELSAATVLIGQGRFDKAVPVRSRDEIGLLSESFNIMTRKIVELLAAEHEKARLDQELSMAQTVQNTFFKQDIVQKPSFHIASFYKPASKCGGDWWGHFSLGAGKELVVMGDATGHGMPAALVTAIAYASTNIIVEQINAGAYSDKDPAAILRALNDLLFHTLEGKLCMSFIAMFINSEDQTLVFSNGGHPCPILIPKDPSDSRLKQKQIPFFYLFQKKRSTNILGISAETSFYNEEIKAQPGDKLIIYTDGLTEAEDKNGRQWGSKGMQKILQKQANQASLNLREALVQDVVQFNAKGDQFDDDVTLVIVEFQERAALAA